MNRLFVIILNFVVFTCKNVNSLNKVFTEQKLISSVTFNLIVFDGHSGYAEGHNNSDNTASITNTSVTPPNLQKPTVVVRTKTLAHRPTSPPRVSV